MLRVREAGAPGRRTAVGGVVLPAARGEVDAVAVRAARPDSPDRPDRRTAAATGRPLGAG